MAARLRQGLPTRSTFGLITDCANWKVQHVATEPPGTGGGAFTRSVPIANASGCVECWTPKDLLLAEGQPLARKTSEQMALMCGPAPTLFQIYAAGEFGGALVLS
jgi:hypothetical protein